jgi:4'-phosphopantetheinyl transferase
LALITYKNESFNTVIGIWKVEEDDQFFQNGLYLFFEELQELSVLKGRKRTEWLSSRYLLHQLSNVTDRYPCLKDPFGKPYFKDYNRFISLSHSSEYTAAMISDSPCGIDVQVIVPKISRIVSKFIRDDEFAFIPETANDILYYHAIWGAKEAMYKAYGKRGLDFKNDMKVSSFEIQQVNFNFTGNVTKGNFNENYQIYAQNFNSIILVYAVQE